VRAGALAWKFDAVSLRFYVTKSWQGWLWRGFSACRGTDVCHMVTVHHYLHALTDGDAAAATQAATRTLQTLLDQGNPPDIVDPNRVCAAGFAVHLLGDSFAHRRLRNPSMYAAGMGHFRDNHDPDYVLYDDDRVKNYMIYARALDSAFRQHHRGSALERLGRPSQKAPSQRHARQSLRRDSAARGVAERPGPGRRRRAGVGAVQARDLRADERGGLILSRTCKDVLETHAPAALKAGLNCNVVWQRFKAAAVPAFKEAKIAQTCALDDAWSDGVSGEVPR